LELKQVRDVDLFSSIQQKLGRIESVPVRFVLEIVFNLKF